MSLLSVRKVSKYYSINKNEKKYVLKDITLTFPSTGLVSVLGKSGCGKSTLLNLIGKLDNPSEGQIIFNNEDIANFKEKELVTYRKKIVSYIFQHYHLLENQSALYNIMLPALLNGDSVKAAKKKVLSLINNFSISKELLDKKCSKLSGGEKERIAIMRGFINKPRIILADEPTGALDKNNALLVMESLKKASKTALVIMVTHNEELAKLYSDRIIHMRDGKIFDVERINETKSEKIEIIKDKKSNPNWYNRIITNNFVKRFKRNIFSIVSLAIGVTASILIFGFANGAHRSIEFSAMKQFDYGVVSFSKEKQIKSDDSPITLIQTLRSTEEEINDLRVTYDFLHYCYSYDSLISPSLDTYINEEQINGLTYAPVYSFCDQSIDKSLLTKGKFPIVDTLAQVVINKTAYDYLKKETKADPLNTYIRLKDSSAVTYYTEDTDKPYVIDYFVYDRLVEIVGVVDELAFLNTPKIYYSYKAMDKYLSETIMNNLSDYMGEISWKERVMTASDNEYISNYSHKLFLKNSGDLYLLKQIKESLKDGYTINSNAMTIEETLFQLVDAASVGMEVFLAIALIGTVLIIGIISFASYSEDIKDSAILLCLGAKREDITAIYIFENFLLGIIAITIAFIVSTLIQNPLNKLIEHFTSLISIIDIPFMSFRGHAFLFPTLIIVAALFVCLLATFLPIAFSKRISLKEELQSND